MAAHAELDAKTQAVLKKKGYTLQRKLAAGAFGQVYSALKSRHNGKEEMSAVKVMDLDKCGEKFKQKFLPRELSVLIQVRHVNVIKVFDIFRMGGRIYIFMEFAPNGTIADYIKKNDALSESRSKLWFTQTGSALQYCHNKFGIAHRDIKVDNIMLDYSNNAKLTDFGFARIAYDPDTGKLNLSETFCGTLPYYCPQILQKRAYNPFKADVWAMGVVLYGMLNNKFPFKFRDLRRMLQTQLNRIWKYREDREDLLSREVRDLISRIFEPDEARRPSMDDVMRHPWCQSAGDGPSRSFSLNKSVESKSEN